MREICPCSAVNGDCPKRKVNCHAKCPEYADYRKWLDELNEKRKDYDTYAYIIKSTLKRRKKRNEKHNI